MSLVEPYSPCPCGSGQKYKWCCQKVEAYAERAQRLLENGQYEAALIPLDEGLAKVPDSAWLLTRKAVTHLHFEQVEERQSGAPRSLGQTPGEPDRGGPVDAARARNRGPGRGGRAVSARARRGAARRSPTAGLAGGVHRGRAAIAAAFPPRRSNIWSSPSVWAVMAKRTPHALWRRSNRAKSRSGRRTPTASGRHRRVFPHSSANRSTVRSPGPTRDSGPRPPPRSSCSPPARLPVRSPTAIEASAALWIADHDAAFAALRRYIQRSGPIDRRNRPRGPLPANRQGAAARSRRFRAPDLGHSQPRGTARGLACRQGRGGGRQAAPRSRRRRNRPKSSGFYCSIGPARPPERASNARTYPSYRARCSSPTTASILEAHDDGRLDRLTDRFTTLAGLNIPPAHPRTRVLRKEPRYHLTLGWRWLVPDETTPEDQARLHHEQMAYVISGGVAQYATPVPPLADTAPGRPGGRCRDQSPRCDPSARARRRKTTAISSTGTSCDPSSS